MHNFPTCQLVLLLAATMATSLMMSLLSHLQLLEHVLTDEGAATTPGVGPALTSELSCGYRRYFCPETTPFEVSPRSLRPSHTLTSSRGIGLGGVLALALVGDEVGS